MIRIVPAMLKVALAGSFALSACSAAPTVAPAVPPPTTPRATQVSSPRVPATQAPATDSPATETLAAHATPAAPLTLTLWHTYNAGGAAEHVLAQLVAEYIQAHPGVTVNVQMFPSYQIFNQWQSAVASGTASAGAAGPDLFAAPNDNMGDWVRAGTLAPLDNLLAGRLDGLSPVAIEAVTIDGHLYAVPGTLTAVALYYNKSTVATPPATTSDLLSLVKGGKRLLLNANSYYNFGFFTGFGGRLMDPAGKCVADQGGFAEAMQYLLDLKAAGAIFQADSGQVDALFESGAADMIIEGPWALSDMEKAWGDQLGVAPLPAGPNGPSRPLAGVEAFYINPRSPNAAAAVDLALTIFSARGLALFADKALDPPARTDVTMADPMVRVFAGATAAATPRPQAREFGNWWGPFGSMAASVLAGATSPANGVKAACDAMNKANGK